MRPQIYETQYRSPQLPLWHFGDDEWLKILRLPPTKQRKKQAQDSVEQQRLFG